MAVLLEGSSLEALVSFTEVSVVQSIDVQALQKLLTRLSEGQAAACAQIDRQQQEIDALKADRQQVRIMRFP
jgi:Tfp pilus assembly protein PilN